MYFMAESRTYFSTIFTAGTLAIASLSVTISTEVKAQESCPCFSADTIIQSCSYIKDMGDRWLIQMNKDTEYGFHDLSCWESRSSLDTKGWTYSTDFPKNNRCQAYNVGTSSGPYKTVSQEQHNSCLAAMSSAAENLNAVVQGQ